MGNAFLTCNGSEAIHERIAGCTANMSISNNTINARPAVALPQISFHPFAPTATSPTLNVTMRATTQTANATLRYTLNGARPTEASPLLPAEGVWLQWPGPNTVFNVRAFRPGFLPSPTQGAIVDRRGYLPSGRAKGIVGNLDGVSVTPHAAGVHGWADDHGTAGGGLPPVQVEAHIDFRAVARAVANMSRPDLVPAGMAPNALHGFNMSLGDAAVSLLQHGRHLVQVFISGSPSCLGLCELSSSPMCVVDGRAAPCP